MSGWGWQESGELTRDAGSAGPDPERGPGEKQGHVPLAFRETMPEEMQARARAFREEMGRRRSVREFASRPVPEGVIEDCLLAAASAPSGANMQPWPFVVVRDPAAKQRIRAAAEREEAAFYQGLAGDAWLADLAALGTDQQKPFLEEAPVLIAVFAEVYGLLPDGSKKQHYYVRESVGLATGLLVAALHHAGLGVLKLSRQGMERVSLRKDARGFIAVRPEDIVIGEAAAQCVNRFSGRLREKLYMGSTIRLLIDVNGIDIIADAKKDAGYSPSMEIRLGWEPDSGSFIVEA